MTTAKKSTVQHPWGDPDGTNFERRYTRVVAVDDLRVKVHRDLAPLAERILTELSQSDLVVGRLEGHPISRDGTGLLIALEPANRPFVTQVMDRFGYRADPATPDLYTWGLGREEALEVSEMLLKDAHAPLQDASAPPTVVPVAEEPYGPEEDPENPRPPVVLSEADQLAEAMASPFWYDDLPGTRDLLPGTDQMGRDVLFLQAYLVTPRTGRYDAATVHAVGYFQGRRGIAADGTMNQNGWQQFLPRLRSGLHPGDAGRHVRILASAMIAAGYIPADEPVSARFNQQLQRHVREMQEDSSMPRTGRVTRMDWSRLLAYPW